MPRVPVFTLKYNNQNITRDIEPSLISITLSDKLEGESDDLEVALENRDLRWMDAWLPEEGALLTLELGYENEPLTPPVSFEIDEPTFDGAPDVVKLKALATPVTSTLREQKSRAFENTTLEAIAQQIASEHGLELVGDLPDIRFTRITQKEMSDLEFLRELAADYGLVFKIESATRLVFFRESELEAAEPVLTIGRGALDGADIACSRYSFRRGAVGTYKYATVSYQDPETGEFIEAKFDLAGTQIIEEEESTTDTPQPESEGVVEDYGSNQETLQIRERVESLEQARVRATEELRRANRAKVEMSLDIEGTPILSAGSNITLVGFKKFNGKYQIRDMRRSLTKTQGLRDSLTVLRIE